ncbi:hypothetical protein M8C21_033231 [Ambrosia artemisiifolia]|uniref:Uncharacterized protein n=1 Tax=Ambrosia artemisiifolia TaxID=4212 RepID=A0AAD5G2E8_AMBAR|nr:hypothetical protein M8C21_033231 [Ambrosia artemisiifolia]
MISLGASGPLRRLLGNGTIIAPTEKEKTPSPTARPPTLPASPPSRLPTPLSSLP